jgi:hypothetical protein
MSDPVQIFVKLLDEDVDVWRPVDAEHVDGDLYRIADQDYDRETETWKFEPGELVVSQMIRSSGGQILAATAAGGADRTP